MTETNPKIVAAAYDLKAAFDLAAAFMRGGMSVEVYTSWQYRDGCAAQVAVYDTESFFMQPEEEYALLERLFRSAPAGCLCFMKSDSSLRGNLGSELAALRNARAAESLLFVPAFPKARKFTQNGVQYQLGADGQKRDVLGNAAQLINSCQNTSVFCGPVDKLGAADGCVFVADCPSQEAFDEIIREMTGKCWEALAGTSALAERLAEICDLRSTREKPLMGETALLVDGKRGMLRLDTLEWKEAE